jgi:hypothetical protein
MSHYVHIERDEHQPLCITANFTSHVRYGSKADILGDLRDVRFTPKSGYSAARLRCPLCAKSGHWLPQPTAKVRYAEFRLKR